MVPFPAASQHWHPTPLATKGWNRVTSEGTCSWQLLLKENTKTARHTTCQTRHPTCQTRNLIEFSTKPSRSLTASFPLKSYRAPTGKVCLPTTIFQGRAVKLQGCNKTVGFVWKVLACNLARGPNWKPETSSQVATQHVKAHYFWRFVAIDHVHKHKKMFSLSEVYKMLI